MHFARLANTLLKDEESARDNHGLACNFAPILFFSLADRIMVMSLWPRFFGPPCTFVVAGQQRQQCTGHWHHGNDARLNVI